MALNQKFLINMENDTFKSVCFVSYNSRGFCSQKQDFCSYLSSSAFSGDSLSVICNQENFVLKGNSYKINKAFPRHHVIVKPAMKEGLDSGRPRNGMFIAIPDVLKNSVDNVSPEFWRLQAVILKLNDKRYLLINSYFPVDMRNENQDETELVETIH